MDVALSPRGHERNKDLLLRTNFSGDRPLFVVPTKTASHGFRNDEVGPAFRRSAQKDPPDIGYAARPRQ